MGSDRQGLEGQGESYVRRHAKAPTAGSTERQALEVRPLKPILAGVLLACALLMTLASSAQAAAPTLGATWSESIVFTEATLRAEVNPEGKATSYRFEYGASEAYGQQTPLTSIGSGSVFTIPGISRNTSACAFIRPSRTLVQWLKR